MNRNPSATPAKVLFLTGAPGVGKSTAGRALADRFEKAYFLDLDAFRENVVKGICHPSAGWTEETTGQFLLAHRAAGKVAYLYSEAGFCVVIAHCSSVEHVQAFLEECPTGHVTCLFADLETNVLRNNTRKNKEFDPRDIEFFVHELWSAMPQRFEEAGFSILETSLHSIQETADLLFAELAD